jgi:hypothetical protein
MLCVCVCARLCVVLGIKPGSLKMLGKYFNTELHTQPLHFKMFFYFNILKKR